MTDFRQTPTSTTAALPYPPSVNHYWRTMVRGKRPITYVTGDGKQYARSVRILLGRAQPLDGDLRVTIFVWVPDLRQRDLDNILKALLDACTRGGMWGDDSQIKDLRIVRRGVVAGGKVIVSARMLEPLLF